MLRGFSRIRPVELAAATVVRMNKEFLRGTLLGSTVKVTERQFPSLYKLVARCAATLQVPVPQVYVANSPVMNAFTFGTEDDSFIVLHSALVDAFSEKELLFVIGHETGHIQNKHVVYNTALILLQRMAELFIGPLILPAVVALNAWYRRAEITCDRAGLLCSQDLDSASRSFIKLAVGSKRLSDEVDMREFLAQHDEAKGSVGRYMEAFQSHPYLPKRIKALQVFAESEIYRGALGQSGGLGMDEVDDKTSAIISMDGSTTVGKEGSST
jgi:Zn-dependent protease with chaperone function